MARAGGVLTFCMIGAVVLGFLLSLGAQASPALGVVALLLYLAAFVMWIVVMVALKVDLQQNGYDRAGFFIWSILSLTVLAIVVGLIGGAVAGMEIARLDGTGGRPDPATLLRLFGPWAVVLLLIVLALQFCFLLLGLRLSEYAQIGGGAWKGAGIVLIIAAAIGLLNVLLYIVVALTQAGGLIVVAVILGFVGLVLWLAVWIMIGVGFMADANRIAAAGAR